LREGTYSGYIIAIVRYEIELSPGAIQERKALTAHQRATLDDALEQFLRHEPTRVSKSRIKRLRGLRRPQYRLRVGEIRVFYDVSKATVEILTIVSKEQADAWLREEGEPEARGELGEGER
jgi:mRNA-degrading endonuclease RelE of RelBE toxin-antitoxin system